MSRLIIFTVFLALTTTVRAQLLYEFDTLTYLDRINGSVDSVDISGSDLPSTFDGGQSVLSTNGLSTKTLFRHYTDLNFARFGEWSTLEFSALPHLGFSYSFGSQGAQFLRAKYNHAFTDNTVLQLNYGRNVGTGILRNNGFTNNDVRLQFQHRGYRYSSRLRGEFMKHDVSHSAGVLDDTITDAFSLEFYTVNKSNAHSVSKSGQAWLQNYFNVLPDSSIALGVMTNHHFRILNRAYTESSDTLSALYDTLYIADDSTNTREQFNLASISNGAGIFFSHPKFYIHGVVDYSYWKYTNLGANYDSTELSVSEHMHLNLKKFKLSNDLKFYFLGRYNEMSERISVRYLGDQLKASGSFLYESRAPRIPQRRFFSNTNDILLTDIQKQNWLRIEGRVGYKLRNQKISMTAYGDFTSIPSVYHYQNSTWTQDSVATNFASIGVEGAMEFGVFNFQPRFTYTIEQNGYIPAVQAYGRLFVKGRLFKAKKLLALIGVDVSYMSDFSTRTYVPSMDTYDWLNASDQYSQMVNLHAFASMEIAAFRFFVRYENIGYFWNDVNNRSVNDYPIAGTRMRIGISWDFFN